MRQNLNLSTQDLSDNGLENYIISNFDVEDSVNLFKNSGERQSSIYVAAAALKIKPGFSYIEKAPKRSKDPAPIVINQLKKMGFSVRYSEYEVSNSSNNIFIIGSQDPTKIENMPPLQEYTSIRDYDESNSVEFGRFIGVPPQDLCWYEEEGSAPVEKSLPVTSSSNWSKDARYARLVPWVSRPTRRGLERASEHGKMYYKACTAWERAFGIKEPLLAANEILTDESHSWYPTPDEEPLITEESEEIEVPTV